MPEGPEAEMGKSAQKTLREGKCNLCVTIPMHAQ